VQPADDADFTAFVAGSGRRLLGLAYLLTGDRRAAEAALESALERTYRRWHRLNREGVPEAYVRKALVDTATERWHWRRPARSDGSDDSPALLRAVAALPAAQRVVLVLRYFENFTDQQTAALLGCSVGAVGSQHARAIARLRAPTASART
jgi:DNA-directed RNA polymerase specialized sigma24 family protein